MKARHQLFSKTKQTSITMIALLAEKIRDMRTLDSKNQNWGKHAKKQTPKKKHRPQTCKKTKHIKTQIYV